ncbi:MAG: bifunctional aspartate transaminase/aspartate 4-decarboxylase [Mycetocola sp.]
MPRQSGIAERFRSWLKAHHGESGIEFLGHVFRWGTQTCGYEPDTFVWELADAAMGDHYPDPPRMLTHIEDMVRRYLVQEMGSGFGDGGVDLFATEGGSAAMVYIFRTLLTNELIHTGDKVAIMTPIFTPYLDLAALYDIDQVPIEAGVIRDGGTHSWQFSDAEIDKLRDPAIRVLYCVNPTNPPSYRIADETLERIADVVRKDNPNLIIVTDDVYGTFSDGFRSLASVVPQNSILVYSFSKYFGATGWRLGTIAIARNSHLEQLLAELPEDVKKTLDTRYSSLTLEPRALTLIDRIVADSREVALNHTAGLSLPQQLQMAMFAAFCVLDTHGRYKKATQALIHRRLTDLYAAADIELISDPERVGYYAVFDFLPYAVSDYGPEFAAYLQANYEPSDILFRLAQQTGIVAMSVGGFGGPPWAIRLSIANLDDSAYGDIGRAMRAVALQYVDEWKQRGDTTSPTNPPASHQ